MATVVFLVGRPGSGKSEATRQIAAVATQHDLPVIDLGDYAILYRMYQADTTGRRFKPADPQRPAIGFSVIDPIVLDTALIELEQQIQQTKPQRGIVLVELARGDYKLLFELLQPETYEESYVLFFEAELEQCIRRIYGRASTDAQGGLQPTEHLISEAAMRHYYAADNWHYMTDPRGFRANFPTITHFAAFRNDGSIEQFIAQVRTYAEQALTVTHYPSLIA